MHHLDGAAGEAEGHGPEGALAGPVGDLVHCGSGVFEQSCLSVPVQKDMIEEVGERCGGR